MIQGRAAEFDVQEPGKRLENTNGISTWIVSWGRRKGDIYILPSTLLYYLNFYIVSVHYFYQKVTLIIYGIMCCVKALSLFLSESREAGRVSGKTMFFEAGLMLSISYPFTLRQVKYKLIMYFFNKGNHVVFYFQVTSVDFIFLWVSDPPQEQGFPPLHQQFHSIPDNCPISLSSHLQTPALLFTVLHSRDFC